MTAPHIGIEALATLEAEIRYPFKPDWNRSAERNAFCAGAVWAASMMTPPLIDAVVKALRKLAIVERHRPLYNGGTDHIGWWCKSCDSDWKLNEPEKHSPGCCAALSALEEGNPATDALMLPEKMTPAIADALGMMCFVTGPIAHAFKAMGHDIPNKIEAEQAFVLFWALKHAIRSGDQWRKASAPELDQAIDAFKAEKQRKGDGS